MAISFHSRKKLLPERPNVGNTPALGTASVTEVIDKYLGCNVRGDKRNINTIPNLSEQFTKAHWLFTFSVTKRNKLHAASYSRHKDEAKNS